MHRKDVIVASFVCREMCEMGIILFLGLFLFLFVVLYVSFPGNLFTFTTFARISHKDGNNNFPLTCLNAFYHDREP